MAIVLTEVKPMHKQLVFVIVILLHVGCGRKAVPRDPMVAERSQPPRAELKIGGDQDEPRHLPFKITAVHEKEKPSADAPFHINGGEWTFFDCQANSDSGVAFTVGILLKKSNDNTPLAWGNAVLAVKDREAGARFVELFSKDFSGKSPTPLKKPYVPRPLSIKTALLGHNMNREGAEGFAGAGGGWTATKWFPEHDGRSGEVFFNYNLAKRQGEFSEKDADYADDLVAVFASALRDGPRPERTPENDPNLTKKGPVLGNPRKLMSRLASHDSFSPGGRFAVYQDRATIFALSLDHLEETPFEVVRFDHSPWTVHVLDDDLNLLVQEGIPEGPGLKSSADPMRIWWVGGKGREKKLLRGPEKNLNLAGEAASPDRRYIAFNFWRDKIGEKGRTELLCVFDRESGKTTEFDLQGRALSVIGWKKTKDGMGALAVSNRWQFDKEPSQIFLANPATGKLERQEGVDARLEIDNPLSPDQKHRARIQKDELIVTDTDDGKQRRLVFHEDDHRFVGPGSVEWVSPRYLKFNGPRLALIDVTTMKMSYPVKADGASFQSHSYNFSSNIRWVLYQGEDGDGEGLFIAPVELRREP